MLINGEKFACEACVRGHRVSSCHHSDRPLVHVNKKGRPVSQCQHCRGLRKSRSQHVKCECHDKGHSKDECVHAKEDGKTEPHTCCCSHGSKCTCALKKDHLEPVPEAMFPQHIQPKETSPKPRPSNMNSHESKATVFQNGHHKPVHKFNDAHNHHGIPYQVPPRSHTAHGHREIAQRSTDNLLLTKGSRPFHESPLHNSTTLNEPIRMVKSEHNSPLLGPSRHHQLDDPRDLLLASFNTGPYGYSQYGLDKPLSQSSASDLGLPDQFPESWFMTYEQAHDYEPPFSSFGLNDTPPNDWANLDLNATGSGFGTPVMNTAGSTPVNFPAFDRLQLNQSSMTPSSGDMSETDEFGQPKSGHNSRSISLDPSGEFGSVSGDESNRDQYRLSTASSMFSMPQGNMMANGNNGSLDIDEYLRQAEAETARMRMQGQQQPNPMQQLNQMPQQNPMQNMQNIQQLQQQLASYQPALRQSMSKSMSPSPAYSPENSMGISEHPFTVHEAQQFAHMGGKFPDSAQRKKSPSAGMNATIDPMWSMAAEINPGLVLDDPKDDEDWVR